MIRDQYYRTPAGGVVWLSAADHEAIAAGVEIALDTDDLIPITAAEAAALIEYRAPAATAADVKTEARRRLTATDWYVTRAVEDEDAPPVPEDVIVYRRAVRVASGEIESLDPIPADYADDSYWPAVVS